jgi:GntR family transcriptional regulator/MocR family aminotransferase
MPKTPSWPTLPLPERPTEGRISDWLHRELRAAILDGRLEAGAKLPSSRSLAQQLGISRGTVSGVYDELLAEGYVSARIGDGTRVLAAAAGAALPQNQAAASRHPAGRSAAAKTSTPSPAAAFPSSVPSSFSGSSAWGRKAPDKSPARLAARAGDWRRSPFPSDETAPRSFRANIPSVSDFPLSVWSRLMSRRLRLATRELLLGCDPMGYPPLREAIARHLRETRGLRCRGAQILIVSGTQMALDLCARLLLDAGDAAWVEDPGYPGASRLLAAAGARVFPIPVDRQGLRVAEGEKQAPHARLAVVTATHHFPLGLPLSLPRRAELLRWAGENDAWIFEDDYDSEFRFSGRPSMGMQGLPGGERVLFCGSFSKMLFPAIRMGFLVLPEGLLEPFRAARSLIDRFPACLEQAVLCDFITEGHFERHLRRMRLKYLERYNTLVEVSREVWGHRLTVDANDTGLQAMAWLEDGMDAGAFCRAAAKIGYEFVPLSDYTLKVRHCLGHPVGAGLQVGFGALPPAELNAAIHATARIL